MKTKVEELRETIGHDFRSFATFQVVDALISAARAEGAEQIKAEILKESMPVVADFLHIPSVIVHVSVLAPKGES